MPMSSNLTTTAIRSCRLDFVVNSSSYMLQFSASVAPSLALGEQIQEILWIAGSRLNATVFVYESSSNVWEPSDVYTLPDFARGLEAMYESGVAGKYFYIGDESEQGYKYGVANIAAFLAQVMKETLRYNACDENSWELVSVSRRFDILLVGGNASFQVLKFRVLARCVGWRCLSREQRLWSARPELSRLHMPRRSTIYGMPRGS